MYMEQITQRLGIGPAVNNATLNSGGTASASAGGIDMSKFHRAFFIVEIGTVVSGGSINLQLVQSASSNLGSPSNVAGSNTSMTGLTTANKQYTLEVRADQVTAQYVGLTATETGGHNVSVTVVGYGDEAIHKPGSAQNDASVVTQNVVS